MDSINHLPGRTFTNEGEEWLYFSGTSYLGIARDEYFQAQLLEGFQRYGSNFGGSRLGVPLLDIFEKAETYLAQLCQAESVLTVSSGTLAGQILIRYLEEKCNCYYAPGTHPATWGHKQAPSISYNSWIEQMLEQAHQTQKEACFITNSIDPLRVQQYSLAWMHQLPKNVPYTLVIDDSHGMGVVGKKGGGTLTSIVPPPNLKLIVVSSLGKAFGIPGGLISGTKELIESLFSSPYFGGASPIIPAYLHAFLATQDHYHQQRQNLLNNTRIFLSEIRSPQHFNFFWDYPVFYTAHNALADFLYHHKILISSFSYPTPQDPKVTRIVLSSKHLPEDLSLLANLVNQFFANLPDSK